jgi:hypothetical protein
VTNLDGAITAVDGVAARPAEEGVIAAEATDDVVAGLPADDVAAFRADQDIVAGSADDGAVAEVCTPVALTRSLSGSWLVDCPLDMSTSVH